MGAKPVSLRIKSASVNGVYVRITCRPIGPTNLAVLPVSATYSTRAVATCPGFPVVSFAGFDPVFTAMQFSPRGPFVHLSYT